MARPTTILVVFFLSMNLFAGAMVVTGTDAALGIDTEIGGDQQTDTLTDQRNNVPSSGGGFSTLFGLYSILTDFIGNIFSYVFPGVAMLESAGVPTIITNQILTPLVSVIFVIDLVSFFRGWGL